MLIMLYTLTLSSNTRFIAFTFSFSSFICVEQTLPYFLWFLFSFLSLHILSFVRFIFIFFLEQTQAQSGVVPFDEDILPVNYP